MRAEAHGLSQGHNGNDFTTRDCGSRGRRCLISFIGPDLDNLAIFMPETRYTIPKKQPRHADHVSRNTVAVLAVARRRRTTWRNDTHAAHVMNNFSRKDRIWALLVNPGALLLNRLRGRCVYLYSPVWFMQMLGIGNGPFCAISRSIVVRCWSYLQGFLPYRRRRQYTLEKFPIQVSLNVYYYQWTPAYCSL